MKTKMPYSVPEGYFDGLKASLNEIPARRTRINLMPYLALAASFLILLAAGTFILNKTAGSYASDEEIIEYLAESGTTLARLEQTVNY